MMTMSALLLAGLAVTACSRDTELDYAPSGIIDKGEPNAGAGLYSSLLFDGAGKPRVAYYHADHRSLRHAHWDGAAWVVETLDGASEEQDRGRQSTMVGAEDGAFYIAYQDSVSDSVRLATLREGKWSLESVDESFFKLGSFLALGVSKNQPVVAYYDQTNGDLMLARRLKGGVWERTLVDEDGDVGRYVSMDVDTDGKVHLAYYDATQGGLRYASLVSEQVAIEKVDGFRPPGAVDEDDEDAASAAGDVGTWTRIRVQPADRNPTTPLTPKILYYDRAGNLLRLAEKNDAGWTHSVVDAAGYVGSDSDFVWTSSGDITAVYLDNSNLDLKIARRSKHGWSHQTLLSEGAVGLYNSLALAPGGRHVGVTTYDLSRGRLVYLFLPVRP
jgi:hypothetical protein